MRLTVTVRVLICSLALVLGQAWNLLAADGAPTEKRLPPAVLLYASVPNLTQTVEDFKDTNLGRLAQSGELQEFRAQIAQKVEDALNQAEEKLEFPISDLASLFSGEVTVAALRTSDDELAGVAFVEIGNHQDILDKLLEAAEQALPGKTLEKETQTLADVEVTVCTITDKEETSGSSPVTLAYFIKDDVFVVANSVSVLESVLVRWDGQHAQTFADAPVYEAIMNKCRSDAETIPAVKWFVDPIGLVTAAMSLSPNARKQTAQLNMLLPMLGLDHFKGLGGAIELATENYDSVSRSMFYVDPPASGLIKAFEFRPTLSAPPAWVPADARQFLAVDWNLQAAYKTIESVCDALLPPGAFEANVTGLLQQSGIELDPRKDIIDVLTGVFQGYLNLTIAGDETPKMDGVLAIGVTDDEHGTTLLTAILDAAGGSQTSDFQGTTVYRSTDDDVAAAIAVKDKTIFVSTSQERLEQALNGAADEPLEATEGFSAVKKSLPAKVATLLYQDAADSLAANYEKLRSGELDGLTEGELDFSVLPPFDVIRQYLTPSASYLVPDELGAIWVQFVLKSKHAE